MSTSIIHMDHVTRTFGSTRAVDDLTLSVPTGIIFGFLGPNGSGKTTTIRLLLGLLEPDAGRAEVLGYDTRSQGDRVREHTGALLEHTGLYERMSAEDNLEFFGRAARMPAAERRARTQELLTDLGLWERRREAVGNWSRGMKQKLAVARALMGRPPLIFLDEPTAGLDPVAAAALRDDLQGLVERQGVTVFLTTHNLAEAERLCAQVGVIRQGRLLAVDSPARLRAGAGPRLDIYGQNFTDEVVEMLRQLPEVAAVTRHNSHLSIDLQRDAAAPPLLALLMAHGVEVEEVHRGAASLEEAFLSLVEDKEDAR